MGLADGRDIELVFRIVRINEIVGNPVCQHEIPVDQGVAEIALLNITIVLGLEIS